MRCCGVVVTALTTQSQIIYYVQKGYSDDSEYQYHGNQSDAKTFYCKTIDIDDHKVVTVKMTIKIM